MRVIVFKYDRWFSGYGSILLEGYFNISQYQRVTFYRYVSKGTYMKISKFVCNSAKQLSPQSTLHRELNRPQGPIRCNTSLFIVHNAACRRQDCVYSLYMLHSNCYEIKCTVYSFLQNRSLCRFHGRVYIPMVTVWCKYTPLNVTYKKKEWFAVFIPTISQPKYIHVTVKIVNLLECQHIIAVYAPA